MPLRCARKLPQSVWCREGMERLECQQGSRITSKRNLSAPFSHRLEWGWLRECMSGPRPPVA